MSPIRISMIPHTRIASSRLRRSAAGAGELVTLLACVFVFLRVASAQASGATNGLPNGLVEPNPTAQAQRLFEEARALMRQSRFDEACPKFDQSQRLDPALGTLINLATCRERQGRLATAVATYSAVVAEARARHDNARESIAQSRLEALSERVSTLVIKLPAEVRAADVAVEIDDRPLAATDLDGPIPLDGGKHELMVTLQRQSPYRHEFDLAESGDRRVIEVPFSRAPESTASAAYHPPVALSGSQAGPQSSARSSAKSPSPAKLHAPVKPLPPAKAEPTSTFAKLGELRFVGLVLGGLGISALAVGSYFGYSAYSLNEKSIDQGCNLQNECPPPALALRQDARFSGNLATASFVAGGLFVASGLGLYLLGDAKASSKPRITAAAGPHLQVSLQGRF